MEHEIRAHHSCIAVDHFYLLLHAFGSQLDSVHTSSAYKEAHRILHRLDTCFLHLLKLCQHYIIRIELLT